MRLGLALGAMLAIPAAGCGAAAPLLTVDQLRAQCETIKGKPVQLAGYLGECSGYDCHLAADKDRHRAWVEAFNATRGIDRADGKKMVAAWDRVNALWPVGIGSAEGFDQKAGPMRNSYVVITGRVDDDTCDGQGGTDRSAGIHPTDIRAWTPAEGAPGNSH